MIPFFLLNVDVTFLAAINYIIKTTVKAEVKAKTTQKTLKHYFLYTTLSSLITFVHIG